MSGIGLRPLMIITGWMGAETGWFSSIYNNPENYASEFYRGNNVWEKNLLTVHSTRGSTRRGELF